jgi:hypothetical protein
MVTCASAKKNSIVKYVKSRFVSRITSHNFHCQSFLLKPVSGFWLST